MKMYLYSIRDDKAEEFGPIFEAKNDEVAKRNFKHMLSSQPLDPAEFALYCVGDFDHDCGTLLFNKSFVCLGSSLFKEEK